MPGCCSLPKTMFARSEVLETSIFMALLDPTLCRDSSRSGVPTCVEQDSSFLQLEHTVIRNHPREEPICRRELPKAGVPGESCHITTDSSEPPPRSWELLSLCERGSTGRPASPKDADALQLLHQM